MITLIVALLFHINRINPRYDYADYYDHYNYSYIEAVVLLITASLAKSFFFPF